MKVLICVWVPQYVLISYEGFHRRGGKKKKTSKKEISFVVSLISTFSACVSPVTFFCPQQMRLPLRSFCTFRSLYSQTQTTNVHRRRLSGVAMRLVQFHRHGDGRGIRVGVEQGEGLGVVDLKEFDPSMPSTMRELLELGDKGLECAQRYQTFLHSVILLLNIIIH